MLVRCSSRGRVQTNNAPAVEDSSILPPAQSDSPVSVSSTSSSETDFTSSPSSDAKANHERVPCFPPTTLKGRLGIVLPPPPDFSFSPPQSPLSPFHSIPWPWPAIVPPSIACPPSLATQYLSDKDSDSSSSTSSSSLWPSAYATSTGLFDPTAQLDDEVMRLVLSFVSDSGDLKACALVCKRWMRLSGELRRGVRVKDWQFVYSGRIFARFPNLTDMDLTEAWVERHHGTCGILMTMNTLKVELDAGATDLDSIANCIDEKRQPSDVVEGGLKKLAKYYPNLRKLSFVDLDTTSALSPEDRLRLVSRSGRFSEGFRRTSGGGGGRSSSSRSSGCTSPLSSSCGSPRAGSCCSMGSRSTAVRSGIRVAMEGCQYLQCLEVHQCTDATLEAIGLCPNVQVVKVVGSTVAGNFFKASVTDIGLTFLAVGCSRLVKLELSGCDIGYEGLSALGEFCPMLEELVLNTKGFHDGWLWGLATCKCLKNLRLEGVKHLESSALRQGSSISLQQQQPHVVPAFCQSLESLQLVRCDLRVEAAFEALLQLCVKVKVLDINDCWGLDDHVFARTAVCKRLEVLRLEGCSLLSVSGLAAVIAAVPDLKKLSVVWCSGIKDRDLSVAFVDRLSRLQELKYSPDAWPAVLGEVSAGKGGGVCFKHDAPLRSPIRASSWKWWR
ncbi:hypothetical protein CBR_g55286 [Chara braunii]|uniref:F-box domain-containing protein n=1 Tax=Chara braunii TaxID=69332 RepID=A0A388MCT5_CHABU|nr:hypothetical protein CBR_g55286 [Chara braunii]|eukprot:GBG92378.1 hypothetical protein CBR_g55286 [Chara braunii]